MINQNLYEFISESNNLPEELKDSQVWNQLVLKLDHTVKRTHYNHKLLLLQEGMVADRVYFVESGIARGFTSDTNSKREKTVGLWLAPSFMTDVYSFTNQVESHLFIEVLPDTILSSISFLQLEDVFSSFPSSKAFLSCLLEHDMKYRNGRLLDRKLSAWEKLNKMRSIYPGMEQVLSKEMIAAFIDISPQHLSRIYRKHKKYS